jgi:chromosome partitioning protein
MTTVLSGASPRSSTRTLLASRVAKIIAVANQKGGVGKTDLCVNVSCYLASLGKKVLLIDMDPQANATDYLGANYAEGTVSKDWKTTADLLLDESLRIEDVVAKECRKNLDIIPADANLSACQVRLANDINMQFKLKRKLKNILAVRSAGNGGYDFVMIDTPPSLGLLTINTLTSAHGVIIPVQTHYFALDGVVQLMDTIRKVKEELNPALEVLGVVLTMYDRRTLLSREVSEKVRSEFLGRVFSTVIPVNVRLAEAPSFHKPIFDYDSHSSGAKAYGELTEEILGCVGA